MIVPNINTLLGQLGSSYYLDFKLAEYGTFSFYMLYILTGFEISKGVLAKWPRGVLTTCTLLSFAIICAYQFWAFSKPGENGIGYDSFGLLVVSAFIFELFRRSFEKKKAKRWLIRLAQISFGIYFVHICIMVAICGIVRRFFPNQLICMLILEGLSFGGAVVVVELVSKVSFAKKYLFMIKDEKE